MGAAGLWAGRPSWRGTAKSGAGVSDISITLALTCHPAVVRDSVGMVSTSPVGGRRPLDPFEILDPFEYALVSSWSSRVWFTNHDKSPNATP